MTILCMWLTGQQAGRLQHFLPTHEVFILSCPMLDFPLVVEAMFFFLGRVTKRSGSGTAEQPSAVVL